MPHVIYQIREDLLEEGEKARLAFGIDLILEEGEKRSFPDLFSDEKKAEEFAALCNGGALSEVHFLEVLDDFLGRESFF